MLTCLCDAFYGEVGIAAVKVLEHAGCQVEFVEAQTCCGQPPFNSGAWEPSRAIARHAASVLGIDLETGATTGPPIVTPSASCAAMIREGYPMLFEGIAHPKVFELGEFLVNELGIDRWPISGVSALEPRVFAFHRACHGRGIGLGDVQERLLRTIPGIEMISFAQADQCCGFGGAFAATHASVSAGIGLEKLRNIRASGATEVVSGDMGCLMHLRGLIAREGLMLRTVHYAEILAEAIPEGIPAR